MPDATPLSGFMRHGQDELRPVAWRRGEALYFRDLEARARCWRTSFEAAPGQRHVLHCADAFEFAAALFGAWHAGKCVLVPSDLQATSVSQLGFPVDGMAGDVGEIGAGAASVRDWLELDPEAPLLEMFTSGSTGRPVGIPKCLRQLDHELAALAATVEFGPARSRVLGTVSHQHMYGLVFRLLLPLVTQRPFEALRLTQVHDVARHALSEGCVLISSPAQLSRLPAIGSAGCRIHALVSAGGALGEDAARSCREQLEVVPTEIYGSSETGAVAWRMRTAGTTSTWQPLPGVEINVGDGMLQIRSRQLPTADWFHSADRVVMNPQGFELAGRSDRIVKIEEKRVSLDAVERVLLQSGLLRQVRALLLDEARPILAVMALPEEQGWQLAAQGKLRLTDALSECLRRSAEIEVLPRSWRFVDPWPVTTDGKSPESLLRARFDRRVPEFRLLERGHRHCVAELWVSPTSPYFDGHFPGHPVLPGVAQIDWLIWLSRELLGVDAGFAGLEAAKFRRIVTPGAHLLANFVHDESLGTSYQLKLDGEICASGRIRWISE